VPFLTGNNPRDNIEGNKPLCGFLIAIDRKGNAGLAKDAFGIMRLLQKLARILAVKPLFEKFVRWADIPAMVEHFVKWLHLVPLFSLLFGAVSGKSKR
jgi:hypothetical protein